MQSFTPTAVPLYIVAMVAVMLYASARRPARMLRARPRLSHVLGKIWTDAVWLHERWLAAVDHQATALGQALVFMAGVLVPLVAGVLVFAAMRF